MKKGTYVDGFVFPVSKKNFKAYKKMASEGARLWKKHGALEYYECRGDDLTVKKMPGMPKPRHFRDVAKVSAQEEVWFSFIVFKSRAHRDMVNKKVMKDPYMNDPKNWPSQMPFDVKKMAYGGFKAIVRA